MHAFTYGCVHACMNACTPYLWMHACIIHACMHAHTYLWMHACMHACMYACTYISMDACMHACMKESTYICMKCMNQCLHVCTCTQTPPHAHTHEHSLHLLTLCPGQSAPSRSQCPTPAVKCKNKKFSEVSVLVHLLRKITLESTLKNVSLSLQ